jgi:hypothetical protein
MTGVDATGAATAATSAAASGQTTPTSNQAQILDILLKGLQSGATEPLQDASGEQSRADERRARIKANEHR